MYDPIIYWIGMAGTVAFAVTGVLAVLPKGIDVFGATVIGMLTALGGGTLRDLVLGVPVFWSIDAVYVWVAMGASFMTFWAKGLFSRSEIFRLLLYLDALGMAIYSIQAMGKVWDLDYGPPVTPVVLGIVTGIGGGLIRDVLAGRPNLLMTSHELYMIPVIFGCVLYALSFYYYPEMGTTWAIISTVFIFTIRSASIYWGFGVPKWLRTEAR